MRTGKPDPGVVKYEEDEGAPVEEAVEAVRTLEGLAEDVKREVVKGDVGDDDESELGRIPSFTSMRVSKVSATVRLVASKANEAIIQVGYEWTRPLWRFDHYFRTSLKHLSRQTATRSPRIYTHQPLSRPAHQRT